MRLHTNSPDKEIYWDEQWSVDLKDIIHKARKYAYLIKTSTGSLTNLYVWLTFKDWSELIAWFYACILAWKIPVFLDHENFSDLWDYSFILSDFIKASSSNLFNVRKWLSWISADTSLSADSKSSDEAIVILTSWTTIGKSKKVILTEQNLHEVVGHYSKIYWLNEWKVIASTLPNYYSFTVVAWIISSMATWGKFIWIDDIKNTVKTAYFINNYKVNVVLGNPNSLLKLALEANFDIPTVELCDSWWIPLSRKTRLLFKEKLWIALSEWYWLTETSTLTHFRKNIDDQRFPGFVWRKINGVNTLIKPIFPWISHKIGILLVSWRVVTPWYLWKKHELEKHFNPSIAAFEDFYNTEDVVYENERGNLYILGRFSDLSWIQYNDLLQLAYYREYAYEIESVNEVIIHKWNASWYFVFIWIWISDPDIIKEKLQKLKKLFNFSREINFLLLEKIPKNINWKPLISSIISKC